MESDYDNDWAEELDKKPQKQTAKIQAASETNKSTQGGKTVKFNMKGGEKEFAKTNPYDKKMHKEEDPILKHSLITDELAGSKKSGQKPSQEELEFKKRNLTINDIVSESKTNQHIIYKFMKKGFQALSAEELACTMVNPTFSIDFKKNTNEDWNLNYQTKVVEKLQRCKFHMHWFIKQTSATGYDDQHESFMKLVEVGELEKILLYLRKNETSQVMNAVEKNSKRTPLHIAAKYGHVQVIEFFLNKGAAIDARDKMLKTPLHYACETGNINSVILLMDNGADPFEKDNCGRTAMHYAMYCGRTDIMVALTQHTTDIVHMKDHAGRTPLHHAVFMEANSVLMISKLLDFGADVNCLDNDRRTPLHHAAESAKSKIIPILIQRGAHTGLKDSLLNKTALELASNDSIRGLIIAYSDPKYMPDEKEINTEVKIRRQHDTRVTKQGRVYKTAEFDMEPPIRPVSRPKSSKKEKVKEAPKKEEVEVKEVKTQVCPHCDHVAGLGPCAEWDLQNQKHIPYNMKNYQERLLNFLRRIQSFGVESFVFQKKPYLYTGSWMEHVRSLDDLMLQINGVNPNEATMKVFNVLFPYPHPLPLGIGDEHTLSSFFDGVANIDKKKSEKDCDPQTMLDNINSQKQDITQEAIKKNDVESVQDLLDIRQEVLQLRSANNALEFQIAQKDELIEQLRIERSKGDRQSQDKIISEDKFISLSNINKGLEAQLAQLLQQNTKLEEQILKLTSGLGNKGDEGKANDAIAKMAEQIDKLIEEKEKLQQKYLLVNERNKQLRHKAGQVFLQAVEVGAGKINVKNQEGAGKIYLEDEEAISRMMQEIKLQDRGDLKTRLKRVSFSDTNMLWQKHFIGLIKDQLDMSDSDQIKLLRVSGFAALKTQDKGLKVEVVLKNIEDRIAQSAKAREDCIKKVAKLMKDQGITLETALRYFDEDGSGQITRNEFNEGFKLMKITLNEALIKNLFVILDKNGDNVIDLIEFEAVFSKYFGGGGPVQEAKAEDFAGQNIDAAVAKDLAKQLNNEIKKTQTYADTKLEARSFEDLQKIEEKRVEQIKAGTLLVQMIGGEIVLRIGKGQGFVELNGKNKFCFQYELPRYDNTGKLTQPGYHTQMKMQDAESGGFKIKLKLPIINQNMNMYQEIIKVSVFKCPEEEENFKTANKTFIGCLYIMWKECVEREQNGESPWINFNEELRDPEQECTVDLNGAFTGQLKWIKFGHKDSSFNEKGEKREAPKLQKTAEDFRGKQVGSDGTLQVIPRKYTHPTDLSLNQEYQVFFELKNSNADVVGEALSMGTDKKLRRDHPNYFELKDVKSIAVSSQEEDIFLFMTVQTLQHGITKGVAIALGNINLNQALYSVKNDKGVYVNRLNVKLQLTDKDEMSTLEVQLKYTPIEKPKVEEKKVVLPPPKTKVPEESKEEPEDSKENKEEPEEDVERGDEEENENE